MRLITLELYIDNSAQLDQTWLGRSGGFAPVSLPLFQGSRRTSFRSSISCLCSRDLSPCLRDRVDCARSDPRKGSDNRIQGTSSVVWLPFDFDPKRRVSAGEMGGRACVLRDMLQNFIGRPDEFSSERALSHVESQIFDVILDMVPSDEGPKRTVPTKGGIGSIRYPGSFHKRAGVESAPVQAKCRKPMFWSTDVRMPDTVFYAH
jgi:hypothetical protein